MFTILFETWTLVTSVILIKDPIKVTQRSTVISFLLKGQIHENIFGHTNAQGARLSLDTPQ